MDIHWLGVAAGLGTAVFQAGSYLASRRFVAKDGQSVLHLMSMAHIVMAVISLCLLPFFWREPEAGWGAVILPLVSTAGFYFLAQWFFFYALRYSAASRISPLLGLKILFVPVLSLLIRNENILLLQWCAVILALVAGFMLNRIGEKIHIRALIAVLATCLGYSLSDLSITFLIPAIDSAKGVGASTFAVILTYILCGLWGLLFFPKIRQMKASAWREAGLYSLLWYSGMATLFYSIGSIGVTFSVILQSTRGLLSVVLAVFVARLGMLHLEARMGTADRSRQVAAAVLMTIAIGLYLYTRH